KEREAGGIAAGVAETLDQSGSHRISRDRNDDRDRARCLFGGLRGWRIHSDNDIDVEGDKLDSEWTQAVKLTARVSEFDVCALSFDPSKVAQPVSERIDLSCDRGVGLACQHTDPTRPTSLLSAYRERPRSRRAAEKRDELAPPHSITSSARASRRSGTVSPSALAVLRLIANSNFVGCITGRSAGFSPLRMRPT